MASGFITLPNGLNWSSRWTRYDYVLEQIISELQDEEDEGMLKKWLQYLLPNEDAGDIESCYCFFKANGKESVLRILDTRRMKDNYRNIFWEAARRVTLKYSKEQNEGILIHQLYDDYLLSITQTAKEPEPEKDSLNGIFFLGGFEIGKWRPSESEE